MQFHNQGICQNKFMDVLGFGRSFEVDAFKIKKIPFYGLQFHPEVDSSTILRWYSTNSELISKYKDSLKKSLINYKKFSPENYIWLKSFLLRVLKYYYILFFQCLIYIVMRLIADQTLEYISQPFKYFEVFFLTVYSSFFITFVRISNFIGRKDSKLGPNHLFIQSPTTI